MRPRNKDVPSRIVRIRNLQAQLEAAASALSDAIKAQEANGDASLPPSPLVIKHRERAQRLLEAFQREIGGLQDHLGIPENLLRAIEESRRPKSDDRMWRAQVEEAPPTDSLDVDAPVGLERLLSKVPPEWLARESANPFRVGRAHLERPLHLVSGHRLEPELAPRGPQAFARMLLVCQDHLAQRSDLDFYAAAMAVPEVAALGSAVDLLPEMGAEAQRKLATLSLETDAHRVASTSYELLVGAAFVRNGKSVTMLPEDRSRKVPDYRVHGLGSLRGAIECKRRKGLTSYEIAEARHVEACYNNVRCVLEERGVHGGFELSFAVPVRAVSVDDVVGALLRVADHYADTPATQMPWGQVSFRRLPFDGHFPMTRLYSPNYLRAVFGADPTQDDWDGFLCEVEAPDGALVDSFRLPRYLRWRSESQEATMKKTRGVMALWGDATRQIPAGEVGFVYIAYPEGGRPSSADMRTRRIYEGFKDCWHRWTMRIPVTMINRLYPRPLGDGDPDLIESTLIGLVEGEDAWLQEAPARVFSRGPRSLDAVKSTPNRPDARAEVPDWEA